MGSTLAILATKLSNLAFMVAFHSTSNI
jgi:hypothetical protein